MTKPRYAGKVHDLEEKDMMFRNTTRKDVMIPFQDEKHPNKPPIHKAVKVGQDVDLPERVGYAFHFAPVSMLEKETPKAAPKGGKKSEKVEEELPKAEEEK